MRVENWNGHEIRFVEKDGSWRAVAADVCKALDIDDAGQAVAQAEERLKEAGVCDPFSKRVTLPVDPAKPKARKTQEYICVNETGLYELIFASRKQEAVAFRHWVTSAVLPALRKSAGLSDYEAFRMMDKEHQKEAMRRLNASLHEPVKVDYIKANTIADKAVSMRHGLPKLVKKAAMNEAMLHDRQSVLDDTVRLMEINDRFNLGVSVSQAVYRKYGAAAQSVKRQV
jgi:prophage antirepressor-like protein